MNKRLTVAAYVQAALMGGLIGSPFGASASLLSCAAVMAALVTRVDWDRPSRSRIRVRGRSR